MTQARILTIAGWAQPPQALQTLLPASYALDYAQATSPHQVAEYMADHGEIDIAVGWSLGGALLMWAASQGLFKPQHMVILAAPVQFVNDGYFTYGMGEETFSLFYDNFMQHPDKTAMRFSHLIAHGDTHYKRIQQELIAANPDSYVHWQCWLDYLKQQSVEDITYNALSNVTLVYGKQDRIVPMEQGALLHERIANSQLIVLEGCGHAPHLHAPEQLRDIITQNSGYVVAS